MSSVLGGYVCGTQVLVLVGAWLWSVRCPGKEGSGWRGVILVNECARAYVASVPGS